MMTGIIKREYLPDRTIGEFTIFQNNSEIYRFFTLEPVWDDNKKFISCIPEGSYKVIPNNTVAHPDSYRLTGVKGRTGIVIHKGNYPNHTEGCVLIGMVRIDIDRDGKPDISSSARAMEMLYRFVGRKSFQLDIVEKVH